MKFEIAKQIIKKYPELHIGVTVAKGIDNKKESSEVDHLLKEIEDYIKLNFVPESLAKHQLISPWSAVYGEFGKKPSKYSNPVEEMMKKILNGKKIPKVNRLVDLCNYLSLKYIIPIGAYDLDCIKGDIILTTAKGTEEFVPLGSNVVEHPEKGEIIFKDSFKVLCRRWNWVESDKTKITKDTKNTVVYVQGLPPVDEKKVIEICKELIELIKTFCKGEAEYYILNKKNSSIEF